MKQATVTNSEVFVLTKKIEKDNISENKFDELSMGKHISNKPSYLLSNRRRLRRYNEREPDQEE